MARNTCLCVVRWRWMDGGDFSSVGIGRMRGFGGLTCHVRAVRFLSEKERPVPAFVESSFYGHTKGDLDFFLAKQTTIRSIH